MDENVYEEACTVSPSSISAARRNPALNPATGTSELLSQPGSSGPQPDNTRTVTDLGTAETTRYIPGVGMMSSDQSKVRPSPMLKIMALATIVLFCLLGAVTVFLVVTIADLKLSVSKQNQKTADELSRLKLSVSKLDQNTAENLANVSSWLQQSMRKTEEVAASLTQLTQSDPHKGGKTVDRQEKHAVTCPGGYKKYREVCYKAFDSEKTFSESDKTCRADGGTLAMPRDAGINDFLVSLKNEVNREAAFWFGLREWEWVDGTALGTGYNAWIGDPLNSNDNCAQYLMDQWFDWYCDREERFICQILPTGSCYKLSDIRNDTKMFSGE